MASQGKYQSVLAGGFEVDNVDSTNNNNGSNDNTDKLKSSDNSNNNENRVRTDPRLRIHWRYPAAAIALFVASVLFAVGHDLYYLRLDGQLADADDGSATSLLSEMDSLTQGGSSQQTWALRIGTALAFLNNSALAAVVALVAAQQIWFTLRRTAMSVDGIDGLFDLLNNPLALFSSWDVVGHAKVVVLVAALSWCLPLASVVTPATLSVRSRPLSTTITQAVPALNLSDDTQWASFGGAALIQGAHFSIATLFSNVYSSAAVASGATGGSNDGIVQVAAPFPNASYDQTLYGPSYKCMSLAEALAQNGGKGIPATWTLNYPKGSANTTFATFEDAFYGELGVPRPGNSSTEGGFQPTVYSATAPSYMFNTILIWTAGVNPLWDNATTNDTAATGSNVVCQLYNTSYDVTLQFADGVQTIVPRDVHLLEPQDWSATAGIDAKLGLCASLNVSTTLPFNSSWGNCSQATGAFYVTHLLFSYLLSATLRVGADGGVSFQGQGGGGAAGATSATLPLLQSPLIHCADVYNSSLFANSDLIIGSPTSIRPARCRNGTLAAAIEDLSRNFTYSLLAFDGYTTPQPPTTMADVTHTEARLFFVYSRSTLWAAYAAAIGATLLAMLLVGIRALLHNGVVSSTSFSSTLLTTRSEQLREILFQGDNSSTYSRSVGAQPVDPGVGQLRLRFGHIVEQQPDGRRVEYAGFGLEGSVRPWREEDE